MYNEPDYSSLSLPELLEKAQDFAKQAFSKSLSSFAFLERALDRTQPGSNEGAEIVEVVEKAAHIYTALTELQSDIQKLTQSLQEEK